MKTEQKLEVYRELFGSLPECPKGKELIGIECKPPKKWEIYYNNNIWLENVAGDYIENRQVAIFQDTHREDGTPLSIDPLPEPPEGYRVEYIHVDDLVSGEENCDRMWRFCSRDKVWENSAIDNPCRAEKHYARLYKIAQPTTLADLVGEDSQKNVWLHAEDGSIAQVKVSLTASKRIHVDSWSVKDNAEQGKRWSHSPFCSWEDAKEFTPE